MGNELEVSMESWLQALWDQGGSDLLLSSNSAPRIRVDGKLFPLENVPELSDDQIREVAWPLLTEGQRDTFETEQDVDFAFSWHDRARIRGSVFTQRGSNVPRASSDSLSNSNI